MTLRLAVVGFRHPHVFDILARCAGRSDVEIVAQCEEDAATRAELAKNGKAQITHDSFARLLAETKCDAVATGDYYSRRGGLILQALEAGKHVLSDKPICTDPGELARIEAAVPRTGLRVGCMFDLRDQPAALALREQYRAGAIGELRAASFGGQHPLMFGTRANWYFEPGKQAGTLNDIAVHAIDLFPWLTGKAWARVTAARGWNARLPQFPFFQDCAQVMLELAGGAGVQGDVSYLLPDSHGYALPLYWQLRLWGETGVMEAAVNSPVLKLWRQGQAAEELPLPAGRPGGYLDAFLRDIAGRAQPDDLNTAGILQAARISLRMQECADRKLFDADFN